MTDFKRYMMKPFFYIVTTVVLSIAFGLGCFFVIIDNHLNFQAENISENKFSRAANIPAESEYKAKSNVHSKSRSLRKIVSIKSKKYKIEPSLIHSIIKVESNWNPEAVSRTGAKGLMQLMPATAKDMNVQNPFDPEENIEGGTRYLRYLLDKFNGDLTLAIAAYNAGPRKIYKFKGVPPIKETKEYVKKIFSIYNDKSIPYSKLTPEI